MMTETLRSSGDRNVLRIERWIAHPPDKVWRAITEPAHLSQWFPATVEFEPEVGAEVRFDMGDEPAADGVVTEYDVPRVFAITWGGDTLHMELQRDGDGCREAATPEMS